MERNENVEKLLKTVEKLGFSKDAQEQVKENMNNGLAEFAAYESVRMGPDMVDYQLNFSTSKNTENPNVYLNSVDVLLNKSITVPHRLVLGFDTQEAETLLMNKPQPEMVNPFNKEEYERMTYVHNAKAEEKMKFLFEHAPEVFNALYIKYRPEVDIQITPEMQQQQELLQQGLVKYNSFSTYYNLTKLELYNALDGGAVLKTLFKINKPEDEQQNTQEQKDNKYKSWVQVNFDKKRSDGSYEMKMYHENRDYHLREVFSNYNFKETNDRFSRGDVIRFMEKGSRVLLTNLGDLGEKQVIARANPEFKGIDLYKLTGEPIRNAKAYLKNPLAVEVGAVVALRRTDDLNTSSIKPEPMTKERREEKAAVFQSAKTIFDSGQKKTSTTTTDDKGIEGTAKSIPENGVSTLKENKQSVNAQTSVSRKTRNQARELSDDSAKHGLAR